MLMQAGMSVCPYANSGQANLTCRECLVRAWTHKPARAYLFASSSTCMQAGTHLDAAARRYQSGQGLKNPAPPNLVLSSAGPPALRRPPHPLSRRSLPPQRHRAQHPGKGPTTTPGQTRCHTGALPCRSHQRSTVATPSSGHRGGRVRWRRAVQAARRRRVLQAWLEHPCSLET